MTAYQPTPIDLTPHDPTVGAGLLAKAAWQVTQLDGVHIHCCGNGHLGFRPDGGSLLKSAKVSKTLLPHHSAPRLGSVCPNTGLNPWAAATRHPWRGAANPASCRVTHEFKPAFGQRGLTGRLRSRSKADQKQIKSGSLRIVVTVGSCRPYITRCAQTRRANVSLWLPDTLRQCTSASRIMKFTSVGDTPSSLAMSFCGTPCRRYISNA